MKIKSVKITHPKDMFGGQSKIVATTEDGAIVPIFDYYCDELSFTEDQFVGMTVNEAKDACTAADIKYIQS